MPAHAFTKAPAGYAHVKAATLPCAGVTAGRGLVACGQVKPGDSVLIIGTAGGSLFALPFAKAAGARVIATSSSEEKLQKLKRFGADTVINYKAVPDWGQQAKDLTEGRGVDHVIEVGGSGTLAQSITACRTGGYIALIGMLTGFAGEVSIPAVFTNQIRISGISVGSRAEQSRADQENMIRAITANRLKPVIDRHFLPQEIVAAFRHYKALRQGLPRTLRFPPLDCWMRQAVKSARETRRSKRMAVSAQERCRFHRARRRQANFLGRGDPNDKPGTSLHCQGLESRRPLEPQPACHGDLKCYGPETLLPDAS
jgi:hypothetical protein